MENARNAPSKEIIDEKYKEAFQAAVDVLLIELDIQASFYVATALQSAKQEHDRLKLQALTLFEFKNHIKKHYKLLGETKNV